MRYDSITVPELRAACRERGLPCYQSKGRRLRKADLVRQLTANVPDRPLRRPAVPAPPKPSPVIEASHAVASGSDSTIDPLAAMRAQAERDLLIDYQVASKHATALGIGRDELLKEDRESMHRILHGCARPVDDRHWRTKEVLRGMVAIPG